MFEKITTGFKKTIAEYRQVRWPSLRTTINLALFVLIISAIITMIILGLDAFFFEIRSRFIL